MREASALTPPGTLGIFLAVKQEGGSRWHGDLATRGSGPGPLKRNGNHQECETGSWVWKGRGTWVAFARDSTEAQADAHGGGSGTLMPQSGRGRPAGAVAPRRGRPVSTASGGRAFRGRVHPPQ